MMSPVIRNYRQRTRLEGYHPYSRRTSTPTPHPESPSSPLQSQNSSNDSLLSYYTAGSSQNPIDVDATNEDPQPEPGPRCERCNECGHHKDNCLTKMFKPRCARCGQYGHRKRQCDTPIRVAGYCNVCAWYGRSQGSCKHVRMSPAQVDRIRGNIPYDSDNWTSDE